MNEYKYTGAVYLKDGTLLSNGFIRIVHGRRGDYVEIHPDQICEDRIDIPSEQSWRVKSPHCFYVEYRTKSLLSQHDGNVKVYCQKREVDYADYKVGMYYVSPVSLSCFEIRGRR